MLLKFKGIIFNPEYHTNKEQFKHKNKDTLKYGRSQKNGKWKLPLFFFLRKLMEDCFIKLRVC